MLSEFKEDTRIVHINDEHDIYIGRPSDWGNPYSDKSKSLAKYKVRTREEAISKYKDWVLSSPDLLSRLHELKGKKLACWCKKPGSFKKCHGDVLIELIRELNV